MEGDDPCPLLSTAEAIPGMLGLVRGPQDRRDSLQHSEGFGASDKEGEPETQDS